MLAAPRALALSLVLSVLAGCSVHPLPEDFSRRNTPDLVQALRCEIARGVKHLSDPGATAYPLTEQDLKTSVVGVDFKLNMDEHNNASAGKLSLANPISGGKFTLDLTGSAEKDRTNERNFRIIDTFKKLDSIERAGECSKEAQRANFLYPIAGSIGLEEVVSSYWEVKGLSTYNPNPDIAFSDKIIFRTKLSAGLSPNITLSSASTELRITNASINGSVVREDTHQVTISIATLKPKQKSAPSGSNKSNTNSEGGAQLFYRSPDNDSPAASRHDSFSSGSDSDSAVESVVRELNRQRARDDLRDFGVPVLRGD